LAVLRVVCQGRALFLYFAFGSVFKIRLARERFVYYRVFAADHVRLYVFDYYPAVFLSAGDGFRVTQQLFFSRLVFGFFALALEGCPQFCVQGFGGGLSGYAG
jgi:hypothetical protein